MSDPADKSLCETVCRAASVRGWGARIERRADGQHVATFRSPQGQLVRSAASIDAESALIRACRKVLPHIAS
jgi:hypothetical protein